MFFSLQSSSTPKCQKDLCLGHDFNSFASYFLPRHLLEFVWQTCFTVDYLKLGIFYYLSFDHVRAKKASDTVVENHSKKSHFPKLKMRHFGVIFRHCAYCKNICVNSRSFRHWEICQSQFISTYFDAFVAAK